MHNASAQNSNVRLGPTGSGNIAQRVPQEQNLLVNASQNVLHNVTKNVLQNVPQNSQQMMQNDPNVPSVPTVTYNPSGKEKSINKDDVRNIYDKAKVPDLPNEPNVPKVPKVQDIIPNVPEVPANRKTNDDDSDSDSDNHERVVHRNVKTSKQSIDTR